MAADNKRPLVFDLEDGDHVELITWPYVMYQLQEPLETITAALTAINVSLKAIDDKLISWIDEEGES